MSLTAKLNHHANLFHGMSQAKHVDFTDALARGQIDGQTLRSAVFRCMQCDETRQCEHWLQDGAKDATAEPTACRNASLLERLGH